jgi:adsorption protein B
VPRAIWGNLVNFVATARAIRIYVNSLRTGRTIAWDKTDHQYPSEQALRGAHRKLGDLLLEASLVSVDQLKEALARQRGNPRLLGLILRDMGVVREDQLHSVLQQQS